MGGAIRLVVADDHPVILAGIARLLSDFDDIQIVGEASDGTHLIQLVEHTMADVVLLDIGMPGPGFHAVIQKLREARPRLAVLALSGRPASEYARRVMKAGAAGYVSKDTIAAELVQGIREAASGRTYVSPSAAEALVGLALAAPQERKHQALSNRELEVLKWSALGKPVKQIAGDLGLSPKTVSTYRGRILKKLGLDSHAQAIRYAARVGIVDDLEESPGAEPPT